MLFVLTGNVQTGKTRWLEQVVNELKERGVPSYGAIAPGVWADRRGEEPSEHVDVHGFEKLGIDNVLLPDERRIPFARRADLAQREGSFDPTAQSASAKLGWHISDEALNQVNSHFDTLSSWSATCNEATLKPGLLVVDELGRLELERGRGLTQALAVLNAGPTPLFPHALVVVREALLPHLDNRFETWGERIFIAPDDTSTKIILDLL